MQYQIAIAPELGLSPQQFAAAWNADAQTSAVAEARVQPSPTKSYDPLTAGGVVIDLLIGLAGSALYQLLHHAIEQALAERRSPPEIAVEQIDQPDGSSLLIVRIKR